MTTETRTPAIDATVHAMYRNAVGTNWAAADSAAVTLKFSNGQELFISADSLPNDVFMQALAHGLKQKLVDAAAISRNPDTGRSATIDDKYNAVREVFDRLMSGQWNKVRDGGASTKGGLLFRALCLMYPDKTPDAIKAFLDKKTPAEKTALRNTARIASIIATFKADEIDDDIDADTLLDELN